MKLRIPTITLLVAIAVSCVSCGDVTDSIVTEVTEPQQTSEAVRTPYIEKNDYGGAVFTVFAPEWGGYVDYMFAEEQTGDAMNDALYERERLVEEYLGVTSNTCLRVRSPKPAPRSIRSSCRATTPTSLF